MRPSCPRRADKRYVRKSDPNRVRTQRNAEIRELRREAEDLGAFLATLFAGSKRGACSSTPLAGLVEGPEAAVWKEICDDQESQRARAELENFRLRRAVQEHANIARGLHHSFLKSSRRLRTSMPDLFSSNRIYDIPIDFEDDESLFEAMMNEADSSLDRIDAIFELNGVGYSSTEPYSSERIRGNDFGRYLDVFLHGILPFPMNTTADVVWQFYNSSAKHLGPLYFKRSKAVTTHADTIVEKYAIEQYANSMRGDFRYRLVIRRYVEASRVVVVSLGFVEPVELANKPFTRCGFQTETYIVCDSLPNAPSESFTRLRRCQRFSPRQLESLNEIDLEEAKQDSTAIMEFVRSLDIGNVHLQQFQDELLQRSLNI